MGTKKKTHEELVKQINVKVDFADKVYKKMRADRYGITYCCPYDLDSAVLDNNICHWQDIKIDPLPEAFNKVYTVDPVANYCEPPGVWNQTLGICEAAVTATTVGTTSYTDAEALPNGDPTVVEAESNYSYGKDCPVIFDAISGTAGGGTNATFIQRAWWRTYDATTNGPINQQVAGVTEVSLVNALARSPQPQWPGNTTLSFTFPLKLTASGTYYFFMAADNQFGFSTTTGGTTTDHIVLSDNVQLMAEVATANGQSPSAAVIPDKLTPTECVNRTRAHCPTSVDCLSYTRGFLYPITLGAGCHTLEVRGKNIGSLGMFACAIFKNTKTEIVNATSRASLNEIFATDTVNAFYSNISASTPYSCPPPSTLYTSAPFSADCPGCRTETSTQTLECPEGFVYNSTTDKCEGSFGSCDTETIYIEVVNQNGDPMPYYDFIWNGGNLTTDQDGKYTLVIQNASSDNNHILNLCQCITTSGGCAEQLITITVTDPTVEVCEYPDLPCDCTAPGLWEKEFIDATTIVLTFRDPNLLNASNDILSYVFEWRPKTSVSTTAWTQIPVSAPTPPVIRFAVTLSNLTPGLEYEYRIKTKCEGEDSGYSAVYTVTPLQPTDLTGLIGWWDFSDVTTLFKDHAGTSPVTAAEDTIKRINNKANPTTANAKLGNFMVSVSDGAKWKANLELVNNGKSYINFTGNAKEPFMSSKFSGAGGVVDGSVFADLTVNNNSMTTYVVYGSPNANATAAKDFIYGLDYTVSGGTPDMTTIQLNKDGYDSGIAMEIAEYPTLEELSPDVPSTPNVHSTSVIRDVTYTRMYINGNPLDTGSAPTSANLAYNNGRVMIGASILDDNGGSLTGPVVAQVYEVIVFSKALSDTDRLAIDDYVATKYGIG
jgi:hypothetical protein